MNDAEHIKESLKRIEKQLGDTNRSVISIDKQMVKVVTQRKNDLAFLNQIAEEVRTHREESTPIREQVTANTLFRENTTKRIWGLIFIVAGLVGDFFRKKLGS